MDGIAIFALFHGRMDSVDEPVALSNQHLLSACGWTEPDDWIGMNE